MSEEMFIAIALTAMVMFFAGVIFGNRKPPALKSPAMRWRQRSYERRLQGLRRRLDRQVFESDRARAEIRDWEIFLQVTK